jgi:RNA polymerase sigma-70 factor (ECF subfamily)
MQETWCRALGAFRRFDPRRASFRAWIFGIASRTLAEELRRLQVRRRELAPAERPEGTQDLEEIPAALRSITQQVAHREELAELLRIAETLAPEERELLVYRGIEGLPHAEVASRLGIAPEACEARWRRLRARLRAQLPEEGLLGET